MNAKYFKSSLTVKYSTGMFKNIDGNYPEMHGGFG